MGPSSDSTAQSTKHVCTGCTAPSRSAQGLRPHGTSAFRPVGVLYTRAQGRKSHQNKTKMMTCCCFRRRAQAGARQAQPPPLPPHCVVHLLRQCDDTPSHARARSPVYYDQYLWSALASGQKEMPSRPTLAALLCPALPLELAGGGGSCLPASRQLDCMPALLPSVPRPQWLMYALPRSFVSEQ